ncbi:methionyl-tRNA formyltransferase [Microbacterium koreense]|uniref:Methionyl-tRNA formyltransferase n=1 Tax=Microbacterium koreense TaxID=323761 RepID=A0ABW2ZTE7_9MICO
MRLVFAGTPAAAVPSLRALAASTHDIVLAVTRRDAPQGRKRTLTPSPVAVAAESLGLDVLRTDRLDITATERISAAQADLGVIVAYGGLVREPLLSQPRHGWINLHFSLLPQWRGAAPVQHAIIAGDAVLGSSIFRLVAELDAGDVYAQRSLPGASDLTSGEALDVLADDGAGLLREVVDAIADGSAHAVPQEGEPTFAPKLTDDDGRVRWSEPQPAVLSRIRGVTPEPGAHTVVAGSRLKIHEVSAARPDAPQLASGVFALDGRDVLVGTATSPVVLTSVQPAGKARMRAADWWRGLRAESVEADA